MIAALAVFGAALAMAWVLPLPLRRLTRDGVSPRLGIAAWLTAITSALALILAALGLLARSAVDGWPSFARTVCESVTSGVCPPEVYRSAAYELGLAAVAFLGGITMIVLGGRYGRSLRRARTGTREHAEAARIVGHRVGGGSGAFVLDATRPAVYCVPGRPPTIVLTTGALAVLGPEQLTAVLAHERAHLAGRHHLLLAATRSLASVTPFVPLLARGTAEVARLAEMRADDAAARRAGVGPGREPGREPGCEHSRQPGRGPRHERGRRTLMAALLAMGAGGPASLVPAPPGPASWLPVTGGAVAARIRRLAEPPPPARVARYGLALAGLTLAIAAAAVLVPVLAAAWT